MGFPEALFSLREKCMMKDRFRYKLVRLKGWGGLILLILLVTFSAQQRLHALGPKGNFQIEYVKDSLTINVENISLGSILKIIREKTGIEFVVDLEQSEKLISIRLGPLPLAEAVNRILSHFNYAFFFGSENKLMKVVILGYASSDSSPRPREVTGAPGAQRVISPSSAETKDIKPATDLGRDFTSSSAIMDIKTPTGEGMIPAPSLEKMVIKPASVEMIVMPPAVEMVVMSPTDEAMASFVENMIIGGFTGASKPKVPAN